MRVVALGGGHGLSGSLSALRRLTTDLTAIVTVADDGGSSGRLREELDVLPPGDLRMALAALCDDTDWGRTWRDVMQHRFTSNPGSAASLDQHAVGNLLIVALWELLKDPVAGLRWAGALLGARGQVLPMSTVPLTITGDVLEDTGRMAWCSRHISGQAKLATAGGERPGLKRQAGTCRCAGLHRSPGGDRTCRLGGARARVPGTPPCCRICCCRKCARRSKRLLPAAC